VLVVLAIVAVPAWLASALLLWLTCNCLRVRSGGVAAEPRRAKGVPFGRTVTLAACWLTAAALIGIACWSLPIEESILLLNAQAVLSLAAAAAVARVGLPVRWRGAVGVALLWATMGAPFVAGLALASLFAADEERQHKRVTCPQCRHAFSVDASNVPDPALVTGCTCPNCRLTIAFDPAAGAPQQGFIHDPGVTPNQRFIAGRGLLGAELMPPERFDLVVHASSYHPGGRGIARLVGLPGEVVAIHQGDLFVQNPGEPWPLDAVEDGSLFGGRFWRHPRADERHFERDRFRILRKPPATVLALMRPVHDSRHKAADQLAPEELRWVGDEGSGWAPEGPGFRHDGPGDEIAWLRYRHLLRWRAERSLITDFANDSERWFAETWMSDLILECDAEVGPSGEVTLELSRGPDRFQARFDLGSRKLSLFRLTNGKQAERLGVTGVRVPAGIARLRFANVDERLTVWVNDRLPFGDGVPYDGPLDLAPAKVNDLDRPAGVGVKGAFVRVKRLRLYHDVHYEALDETRRRGPRGLAAPLANFDAADPGTWGLSRTGDVSLSRVGESHYFMLNDDRHRVDDSRWYPPVEKQHLIGRALFRFGPLWRVRRAD
jgi:signal peptidase I